MLYQMMIFAMNWNEKFWTDEIMHEFQFFSSCVPRDMDSLVASINNIRAEFQKIIDCFCDEFFITWNWSCRNYHSISRDNSNFSMIRQSHSSQSRHRFALRSSCHDYNLIHWIARNFIDINQRSIGSMNIAEIERNRDNINH